jgi:hypothetical protein
MRKAILENATAMKDYIKSLNTALPCSTQIFIQHAHLVCPDIANYCKDNADKFTELKLKDKGGIGKKIEFYVFGNLPNSNSMPDSTFGDIKTTHIKKCRGGWNAKERVTLTNCGSTNNYDTLQHIVDSDLKESRLYPKIRNGIMVVLHKDMIHHLFRYDIEEMDYLAIDSDYKKIQESIVNKAVSQKGQQFLHIHPHGSKGSKTRALGFTNRFVTTLISHYCELPLRTIGKSIVF